MSASFKLEGLDELRKALRELPEDLAREGGEIVEAAAREAAARTQQSYPEVSGNLKRGVRVEVQHGGRFGKAAIVKSRARHSHLFERGTGTRQNRAGANRGRMPEAKETQRMIPIVIRRRRIMFEALKNLVRKAGFQISE
jgi:hypothetical protein